ncbi:MAG: ribosome biogenesis GTPase YlqF [Limnochordia bacterium]
MTIQWYPGHMAKTRRMLVQELKVVDAALELVDARVPFSGRNPDLAELVTKPRLVILTKCDLADQDLTDAWVEFYRAQGEEVIGVNLAGGKAVQEVTRTVKGMFPHLRRAPRVMVVGVPNVGKSTLINRIVGRRSAKVGARPGVTRGKQWLSGAGLQLLDSPGILWPKFDDQDAARKLAITAAIRDEVFDQVDMAEWLVKFMLEYYPEHVAERYGQLAAVGSFVEEIGRRRGCLRSGGVVDLEQSAMVVLTDFRGGRLGRVTLDRLGGIPDAPN